MFLLKYCFITLFLFVTVQAKAYNGIVFFPDTESRPSNESFSVKAEDRIPFCVSFSDAEHPFLVKIRDRIIGFKIVMEDQQNPPRRLALVTGHRHAKMKPDTRGCFRGEFFIPSHQVPGLYQVADFYAVLDDNSFYSLREYLFSLKQVDELNIESPSPDAEPPKLVGLGIFGYPTQFYKKATRETIVLKPRFYVQLEDPVSGLFKGSLRAFFQIKLKGQVVDLIEVPCRRYATQGRFVCKQALRNLLEDWYNQDMVVELASLVVEDRVGNIDNIDISEYFAFFDKPPLAKIQYTKGRELIPQKARYLARYVKKYKYTHGLEPETQEDLASEGFDVDATPSEKP